MGFFSFLASVAAPILGGLLGGISNNNAAKEAAAAQDRATAAIVASNEAAQARFDEERALAAPSISALRRVASSNPGALTPTQRIAQQDLRRGFSTSAAALGLRGAGRAGVAASREAEGAFNATSFDQNQRRIDDANNRLANVGFESTSSLARLDTSTGQQIGAGELNKGTNTANAGLANTVLTGQALGTLSSIFADEDKRRGRPSREKKTTEKV